MGNCMQRFRLICNTESFLVRLAIFGANRNWSLGLLWWENSGGEACHEHSVSFEWFKRRTRNRFGTPETVQEDCPQWGARTFQDRSVPKQAASGWSSHMGGCQNYIPFLGTLNIRCRIIIGIQKGTIILTTTHMFLFSCRSTWKHSLKG